MTPVASPAHQGITVKAPATSFLTDYVTKGSIAMGELSLGDLLTLVSLST